MGGGSYLSKSVPLATGARCPAAEAVCRGQVEFVKKYGVGLARLVQIQHIFWTILICSRKLFTYLYRSGGWWYSWLFEKYGISSPKSSQGAEEGEES